MFLQFFMTSFANVCMISQCGCKNSAGKYKQAFCSENNSVKSAFCNANAVNCERHCNGEYCDSPSPSSPTETCQIKTSCILDCDVSEGDYKTCVHSCLGYNCVMFGVLSGTTFHIKFFLL